MNAEYQDPCTLGGGDVLGYETLWASAGLGFIFMQNSALTLDSNLHRDDPRNSPESPILDHTMCVSFNQSCAKQQLSSPDDASQIAQLKSADADDHVEIDQVEMIPPNQSSSPFPATANN